MIINTSNKCSLCNRIAVFGIITKITIYLSYRNISKTHRNKNSCLILKRKLLYKIRHSFLIKNKYDKSNFKNL